MNNKAIAAIVLVVIIVAAGAAVAIHLSSDDGDEAFTGAFRDSFSAGDQIVYGFSVSYDGERISGTETFNVVVASDEYIVAESILDIDSSTVTGATTSYYTYALGQPLSFLLWGGELDRRLGSEVVSTDAYQVECGTWAVGTQYEEPATVWMSGDVMVRAEVPVNGQATFLIELQSTSLEGPAPEIETVSYTTRATGLEAGDTFTYVMVDQEYDGSEVTSISGRYVIMTITQFGEDSIGMRLEYHEGNTHGSDSVGDSSDRVLAEYINGRIIPMGSPSGQTDRILTYLGTMEANVATFQDSDGDVTYHHVEWTDDDGNLLMSRVSTIVDGETVATSTVYMLQSSLVTIL